MTEAAWSTAFSSAARRSIRAASRAFTVAGTSMVSSDLSKR